MQLRSDLVKNNRVRSPSPGKPLDQLQPARQRRRYNLVNHNSPNLIEPHLRRPLRRHNPVNNNRASNFNLSKPLDQRRRAQPQRRPNPVANST